jgi:glycosyltransferase involved in cell wall biosynthesis
MLTLIIPTKNHGIFLEEMFSKGVFSEHSPVSKLLICNDASTDDTAAILAKYAGNDKLRVFENEASIGALASITMMYPHVETPYVTFMASDDNFFPEKLSRLLEQMIARDAYVGFGKYVIMENGATTELQHPGWQARNMQGADDFRALFGFDHYMFLCTTIFKKEMLPQYGPEKVPFDLSLNDLVSVDGLGEFRGQDWNVALEMAREYPGRVYFLDEYCGYFLKIASQLSSSEIYNDTGRGAFEMALLILRHLTAFESRKRIKESEVFRDAVKNLFYAKCGQITETAKQSHNFLEIYKPVLLTADALLNNM